MVSTDDVLEEIADLVGEDQPVTTASELADNLPVSRRTVLNRLRELEAAGDVASHRFNQRTVVWWPVDAVRIAPSGSSLGEREPVNAGESGAGGGSDPVSPAQTPPMTPEDPAADTGGDDEASESGAVPAEPELVDGLRAWLEDHPPEKNHAQDAVVETFRHLRRQGSATTSELQEHVYDAVNGDHYSDPRTMWNSIDRYLEDVPGVEKAGYGEWGYAGDEAAWNALEAAGVDADDAVEGEAVYDPTDEF